LLGHRFLKQEKSFCKDYFIKIFQEIKQTSDKIRPPFIETTIKQGGTGPDAGKVIYTPPNLSEIYRKNSGFIGNLSETHISMFSFHLS